MEIQELIEEKKKTITTEEDKYKISIIEGLVKDKNWAFKIDSLTATGVLIYLGLNEEEAKKMYFSLISSDNYVKNNKIYTLIDDEETKIER